MQKKLANLFRLILSDKNTRNLSFFLLLNLVFAFVELTYGLWTNSLGLISDSFHMFFDCSALLLGLAASIVSKWKPSETFTYGFGRAEILTGLANGLFLLFIALFIMKEAIERSFEPPEVHHERLFIISVLGFIVNLVGIFVFQHGGQGHSHGSGGCSHSHSHSHSHSSSSSSSSSHKHHHTHEHNHVDDNNSYGYSHYSSPTIHNKQQQAAGLVALDMNGYSTSPLSTAASYTNNYSASNQHHHHQQANLDHHHHHDQDGHHHHHHSHGSFDTEPFIVEPNGGSKSRSNGGRGQIMQSVFLHIVADTLGSIGVMISAVLMNQFGWMIVDPLCSLFIAILISISVYPLLRDSFYILMQRVPVQLEAKLPSILQKIQSLDGVLSIHETHFWTLSSDTYVGCLKLEVANGANHGYVLGNTKALLAQLGVDRVHIQIDQV